MVITQKQVRQFLLIGGSIFALTMAYGSGMRSQVHKIQEKHEQYKIFRQEARIAQLSIRAKDAQIQQLEARRLLDVAQNNLERGDIVAARANIAEAVTRLQTAQKADAATTADFAGLIDDLSHFNIAQTSDAKTSLNSIAAGMDEKLVASDSFPAPDTLFDVTIPPPTDNEKPVLGNDLTRVK